MSDSLGGFVLVLYSKRGEAAGCVPVSWQRFIRQQKRRSEVSSAGELWRLWFFLRSAERDEQVSQPRRDGDWTRPTGTRGEEDSWWKAHARVHGYLMCPIETRFHSTANAQTEHVPETRSVYTNELKLFISSDKPEVDQLCWRLLMTCRWSWCLQPFVSAVPLLHSRVTCRTDHPPSSVSVHGVFLVLGLTTQLLIQNLLHVLHHGLKLTDLRKMMDLLVWSEWSILSIITNKIT